MAPFGSSLLEICILFVVFVAIIVLVYSSFSTLSYLKQIGKFVKSIQLQQKNIGQDALFEFVSVNQMESLLYMHDAVSSEYDMDSVIQRVIRASYIAIHAERISVLLLSRDSKKLVFQESIDAMGHEIPATKGISGYVVTTGEIVNIADAYGDPRFNPEVDTKQNFKTKSILCVPIRINDRIVGVIEAINKVSDVTASPSLGSSPPGSLSFDADASGSGVSSKHANRPMSFLLDGLLNLASPRASTTQSSRASNDSSSHVHQDAINNNHHANNKDDGDDNKTPSHAFKGRVLDDSKAIGPFSKADTRLLVFVAANAGIAIKRAHLHSQVVRAKRQAQSILTVVRSRSDDESLEQLIERIIDAAYQLVMPERVSVYLVDHVKRELWVCVSKDGLSGLRLPIGKGIAGYVAGTGSTLNIPDAYADGRFNPAVDKKTGFRTRSMLCMAVPGINDADTTDSSKPIAVIQLINKIGGKPFDEDDESALSAFCAEVSMSLRRKILETSLLKLASDAKSKPDQLSRALVESSMLQEYGSSRERYSARVVVKDLQLEKMKLDSRRVWPSHDKKNSSKDDVDDEIDDHSTEIKKEMSAEIEITTDLQSELLNWDLDVFRVNDDDKLRFVFDIFSHFRLLTRFNVDPSKLRNFLLEVHTLYHPNPFHNFNHAFAVFHQCFLIVRDGGASWYLTSLDVLAIFVASLCHDIDHPGTNNSFEAQSNSRLALMFSDDSVLERHHVHVTFQLLIKEDSDIIQSLSREEKTLFRKLVIESILGTDMSRHFKHVEMLERHAVTNPPFNDSMEDKTHLISSIVHAADLSGQTLSYDIAIQWGNMVMEEFINQAQREVDLRLTPTAFMQELNGNELRRASLQLNFTSNIVCPLWSNLSRCLPNLKSRSSQAVQNRDIYQKRVDLLTDAVPGNGAQRRSSISM